MSTPELDMSRADPADLLSVEFSGIRSDLSNLRTLLSWARTAISMIGFGFTISSFSSTASEAMGRGSWGQEAAKNLGLGLVVAGILSMVIAVWNFWSINQYVMQSPLASQVSRTLRLRWLFAYVVSVVLLLIGVITFLFMVRVI